MLIVYHGIVNLSTGASDPSPVWVSERWHGTDLEAWHVADQSELADPGICRDARVADCVGREPPNVIIATIGLVDDPYRVCADDVVLGWSA